MKALLDLAQSRQFLSRFLSEDHGAFELLLTHGHLVAEKALSGAQNVASQNPDLSFLYEASLLHDVGIIQTKAPTLNCFGKAPYLAHGVLGAQSLKKLGMPKHARVCERHVGVCLSKVEVIGQKLSLPKRDYIPKTLEETLIAWADKFYSKTPGKEREEKSLELIQKELRRYSEEKIDIFLRWNDSFS